MPRENCSLKVAILTPIPPIRGKLTFWIFATNSNENVMKMFWSLYYDHKTADFWIIIGIFSFGLKWWILNYANACIKNICISEELTVDNPPPSLSHFFEKTRGGGLSGQTSILLKIFAYKTKRKFFA